MSIGCDVGLYNSTNSEPVTGLISTSLITIELDEVCESAGVIVPPNNKIAIRPNKIGFFTCICYSYFPFLPIIESN
jgi:hypothetical protein